MNKIRKYIPAGWNKCLPHAQMSGTHNVQRYLDHLEFCGRKMSALWQINKRLVISEKWHQRHHKAVVCFQMPPLLPEIKSRHVYTKKKVTDRAQQINQESPRKKRSSGIKQDIEVLEEAGNKSRIVYRILWTQSWSAPSHKTHKGPG